MKEAVSDNLELFHKLQYRESHKDKVSEVRDDNKPTLTKEMISKALNEVKNSKFTKFTGLVAHICYWTVLGNYNPTPLDDSYKKILFVEATKIQSELDMKYNGTYLYTSLIMPILILCLRIEIDAIFKY